MRPQARFIQKNRRTAIFLVEMAVIETASEK